VKFLNRELNSQSDFPIISIVTPSYNQGQFISDTIESVISQEGDFYIDYIIMDGASKDNSVDVIRTYSEKVNQCQVVYSKDGVEFRGYGTCKGVSYRWWSEKDGGPVEALNKGIDKVIGEYFCWMNSDDRYASDKSILIILNEFLKNTNLDMVTADGYFIDTQGNRTGEHYVKNFNAKECYLLDYHILQPSTMIKSKILTEVKLKKYSCVFDFLFYNTIISRYQYLKINEFISEYRMWGSNITDSRYYKRYFETIWVSMKFVKRVDFLVISFVYRFFEIVLKPYFIKKIFFQKIFFKVQNFSYKYITGKGYRQ
jgi:glycosyltransferase involved in cell wall biosynthesis